MADLEKLEQCAQMYLEDWKSLSQIEKETGVSRKAISKYLKENKGVTNTKRKSYKVNYEYTNKKFFTEDPYKDFVLVDKKDPNVTIKDANNRSGEVSRYLSSKYGISSPSAYFSRKHFEETGEYWYEQYFDVKEIETEYRDKSAINVGQKPSGYWKDKEHCREAAQECSDRTEYKKRYYSAYESALKNKWLDEFFEPERLPNGYWDDFEKCQEVASNCIGLTDLFNKYPSCYNTCRKNGTLYKLKFNSPEKIEIDEGALIEDYVTNNMTLNEVANKYGIGYTAIKTIFSKHGVETRGRGGVQNPNKMNPANKELKWNNAKKGYRYVAISKLDGTKLTDVSNKGGALTKHLDDKEITVPDLYHRRKYEIQNGVYDWFMQYFDFIEEPIENE